MDFKVNSEGQLILSPSGDVQLVVGDEALLQELIFRLKTFKSDYLLSPNTGASLDKYIGQPADLDTLDKIKADVEAQIANMGSTLLGKVWVAEVEPGKVGIAIELNSIDNPKRKLNAALELDLLTGKVYDRSDLDTI